nr:dihydrolipoamide acetyltransferase family protein [Polycladospora coralii]
MSVTVLFRLPDVGEGVAEAEVVKWLVQVGEPITENQPVVEVQTDKAIVELPSPATGALTKQEYAEGEIVPVGAILYEIDGQSLTEEKDESNVLNEILPKRVLAAPSTRRKARERGIPLEEVKGTGPAGRVLDQDLDHWLNQQNTEEDIVDATIKLSPTRRVIAQRLQQSIQQKPHVTHFATVNVNGLVDYRNKQSQDQNKLSYLPILLKIMGKTLQMHPLFNAHYDEQEQKVTPYPSVSIGLATDTENGLLVPVLHQVETKNMDQLSTEASTLMESAKGGKCTAAQLSGSTFTVSNTGPLGGAWATPIINPPEVAIAALHPIERVPVVEREQLGIGWRMNVSLSFDHRVLDGADAIRFTNTLEYYTEDPTRLLREWV